MSNKYCIWNNKGGVGKFFLTFCLATEYALRHSDELVVVADMCPQSNVSEMLLGGNGLGEINQAKLRNMGSTVVGYIKDRYLRSRFEKLGTELQYFVNLAGYNTRLPSNMFLLSGDTDLDLASVLISSIEKEQIKEAPTRAMSLLKDILSAFEEANRDKKVTMFIDCNPSFAVYTELAVLASNKLIIPCTGDFASLVGIKKVMQILYNIGKSEDKNSMFNITNFVEKMANIKMTAPTIHLGIINKSRVIDKQATAAYSAHVTEIENYFGGLPNKIPVKRLKDCNNVSLVVNYTGIPISKLEQRKYRLRQVDTGKQYTIRTGNG
jgi:cellulose biosynthesis protein BcsQ